MESFLQLELFVGIDAFSTDDWDGYPANRQRLLQHIHDSKVANPVVLSGDIHSFFANDLKLDFDNPIEYVALGCK